jgi:hypothetical protein
VYRERHVGMPSAVSRAKSMSPEGGRQLTDVPPLKNSKV